MNTETMSRVFDRLAPIARDLLNEAESNEELKGIDKLRADYALFLLTSALDVLGVENLDGLELIHDGIMDTANFFDGEIDYEHELEMRHNK